MQHEIYGKLIFPWENMYQLLWEKCHFYKNNSQLDWGTVPVLNFKALEKKRPHENWIITVSSKGPRAETPPVYFWGIILNIFAPEPEILNIFSEFLTASPKINPFATT